MKTDSYPTLSFTTQDEFCDWLEKEHDKTPGVWIKIAKKNSGEVTINYDQALEIALCFGWIDGVVNRIDEKFYKQKFTPRGPKSVWSKINCDNVTRLIAEGKMRPAGLEKINQAKKDGRWDRAYDSPKNMVIPEDFLTELKKDRKAYEFFLTLNKTNRYAIGYKLQTAIKAETRQNRIKVICEKLSKGEKFY